MQVVQRELQHRAQAQVQRGFVEEELRRVVARRRRGVLPGGRGADEEEHRGDLLRVVGEILGAHVQRHVDQVAGAGHGFQARAHARGQRRVVGGDRGAFDVGHLRHHGGAVRGGDLLRHVGQVGEHRLAHVLVEGADGADHLHAVGNDVEAHAAADRAEAQHHRLPRDVLAAADHGLRGADDVGRGHDRVDAAPGPRAMRLPALHHDVEAVGGGHRRAAAHAELAGAEGREHVQAEHGVRLEVLEDALRQHHLRAALLAVRRTFLGRLEHEQHLAGQLVAHRHQRLGHAHQDAGVGVVAAGVHHADGFAVEGRGGLRREGQAGGLGHRQRVHVGAQRDARAGLAALEHGGDAGGGDAGLRFQAKCAQVPGHQRRGARLAVAELGVLVDVAAPVDHLGLQALRGLGDFGALRLLREGGRGGQRKRQGAGQRQELRHGVPRAVDGADIVHQVGTRRQRAVARLHGAGL